MSCSPTTLPPPTQIDYKGDINRRDFLGDCHFNLGRWILETKRDLRTVNSPEWPLTLQVGSPNGRVGKIATVEMALSGEVAAWAAAYSKRLRRILEPDAVEEKGMKVSAWLPMGLPRQFRRWLTTMPRRAICRSA